MKKKKTKGMVLGTNVLNRRAAVISEADRKMHMHIIGTTGAGKSKLMELMIRSDIKAGRGLCLMDPHGDLYQRALEYVIRRRLENKVILIDPNDEEWAVGINFLEHSEHRSSTSHASEVMRGIAKVFGGEDTDVMPRLQRWERNALVPLIVRKLTLIVLSRLVDPDVSYMRELVLKEVKSYEILDEWKRFENASKRDRENFAEPVFNRAAKFVASDKIRQMFGQVESTVDFRQAMDEGKIILCNLACTKISQEERKMLGVVIIDKIVQAGMSRMDIPERRRRPFYFYLDEFAEYVSKDIAGALTGLRKFNVRLILAHQELEQLRVDDRKVYSAVMAEPQVKVAFRTSREDAERLVGEYFTGNIRGDKEKRRLYQTKFRPVETTRTIRTESSSWADSTSRAESSSWGSGTSQSSSNSSSAGESTAEHMIPRPMFLGLEDDVMVSYTATDAVSSVSGVSSGKSSSSGGAIVDGKSNTSGGGVAESEVPFYEYEEFQELSSIVDFSVEELIEKYIAWLKTQGDRHFQLKVRQKPPVPVLASFVKDLPVREKDIRALKEKVYSRYAIPAEEADRMINQRRAEFLEEGIAAGLVEPEEPPALTAADMRHSRIETRTEIADLAPQDMRRKSNKRLP